MKIISKNFCSNNIRKNYYGILGINQMASTEEVKRAYYKMAKMYHPDAGMNKLDEDSMKDINSIYFF